MTLLYRSIAAIGGFSTALYQLYPRKVATDNSVDESANSWISWMLGSSQSETPKPFELPTLRPAPGKVMAWGATFGKRPMTLELLGDQIIQVAAADTMVAAVDVNGKAMVLHSNGGQHTVYDVQAPATKKIAIREAEKELVCLDKSGSVRVSKKGADGSFQPLRLLEGSIKRARIEKLECGNTQCVAISKRGDVFVWGHRQNESTDQQSNSQLSNPPQPQKVDLPNGAKVSDAACGDKHCVFLDRNGAMYAVGDDQWAQLGISAEPWRKSHVATTTQVQRCTLLEGLAGQSLAAGGEHSVLLAKDGTVFSWGFNQFGQLGHHNYSSFAPPAPISDFSIRAIAIFAGTVHTCLVKDTGELMCIGGNEAGQLGNGNLQPSKTWKRVREGKKTLKPSCVALGRVISAAVIPSIPEVPETP